MSSQARTLPLGLSTDASIYRRAIFDVGRFIMRGALIVFAVWLMAGVRSGHPIYVQGLYYVLAMSAVYFALGAANFRAWGFYITAFVVFAQLRGYADGVGTPTQFDYPVTMEKALFFGEIPSIWLQDRLYTFAHLGILETYTIGVYLSYFTVPHILAFALWKWDRPRFKTYAVAFMATLYIGLLVAAILPTAPPWMAGQLGYIPHVYQIVPDITQELTPGAYENVYEIAGANPVAAMPSLHSAVPMVMAIALWKYPILRWIGLTYAVSMVFSVVYLGEHYAVDGFAGWAAAGVSWIGAKALLARLDQANEVNETAAVTVPESADSTPEEAVQVTRG